MDSMYFNLICSEIEAMGGITIHEDVNKGSIEEIHEYVKDRINLYPNATWVMIPMTISMKI